MSSGDETSSLRERVWSLAPWQYRFALGSDLVTPHSDEHHDWNLRRRKMLLSSLDGLVALRGGYAANTFLDCACNAGLWSFELHRQGARRIRAFDARPVNIEKCRLVQKERGIPDDEIEFEVADLYDLQSRFEPVDVSLALGLFYHLRDPIDVAFQLAAVTRWAAVIDCNVGLEPTATFEIRGERPELHHNGVEPAILLPSRAALIEMLVAAGFDDCLVLEPPPWAPRYYRDGQRIILIALKHGNDEADSRRRDADESLPVLEAIEAEREVVGRRVFWSSGISPRRPGVSPELTPDQAMSVADRHLNGRMLLALATRKLIRKLTGRALPLPAAPGKEGPDRDPNALPPRRGEESERRTVLELLDAILSPEACSRLRFDFEGAEDAEVARLLSQRGLRRAGSADVDLVLATDWLRGAEDPLARAREIADRTRSLAIFDARPLAAHGLGADASAQTLLEAGFGSVHWCLTPESAPDLLFEDQRALLIAFKAQGPDLDATAF